MVSYLLFISLFLPNVVAAQDVWIHASGIDRNLHTQNFTYFYEEARDFLRECKASPLKPDCHLYINPDKTLASKPDELKDLDFTGQKIPTAKMVLEDFRRSIKKAKPGDTIILSLANHGGPTAKGNSCIFLSGVDYLCETDLAKVLKERPAGVKVYINADGCFSGAFVDIASKDVCVTTWADRRAVGVGGSNRLWNHAITSQASLLSDLKKPMELGFEWTPTMASQSMKNIMCMKIRAALYSAAPAPTSVSDEVSDQLMGPFGCSTYLDPNDRLSVGGLAIEAQQYLNLITKLKPFSCEQAGLSGEDCNFFTNLQSEDLRSTLVDLQQLGKQFDDSFWHMNEFYTIEAAKLKADLPDEDLRHCAEMLIGSKDYTADRCYRNGKTLDKDSILKVTKEIAAIQKILTDRKAEQVRLSQEFHSKVANLFSGKYAAAYQNLESCLFDVEDRLDHKTSDPYLPHGANYPRKFTEQDVKDASSCESSIHFR